ncbi:MAG: hypothetical protein LBU34_15595 [Planctomycetaceae bacterium]|jgi:predicted transcriptional regulator|nr:hypothetical protein [Planctomycetaceae bacterium]
MSIIATQKTHRATKLSPEKIPNQKITPFPFEKLPKELQEGLEEGLRDVDAGRVTPHEEVFRKLNEWLKNN